GGIAEPIPGIHKGRGLSLGKTIEPAHFQSPNNFADDAVDGQVRAVDYESVLGDDQRRRTPRGISPVARGNLVALAFSRPPARTDFRRGVDVKLIRRLRKNDRTDIAAFDDQIVITGIIAQLLDKDGAD